MSEQNHPDLLIENGRLIDPSQSIDRDARLLIRGGQVAAIDPSDGDLSCRLSPLGRGRQHRRSGTRRSGRRDA